MFRIADAGRFRGRVPAVVTLALTLSLTGGALSAPASAAPASSSCHMRGVKVAHGELAKLDQNGKPSDTTVTAGGPVKAVVAYRAMKPTRLQAFDSTGELTKGTNVMVTCYGMAVGDPADNPALSIIGGTATVHDSGKRPLGVLTLAALVSPYDGELAAHPSLGYVVREHEGSKQFPTTVLHVLKGTPSINVTPYAGPHPGSCRHAIWAKLVYNPNNGGTAKYKLGH